MTTRTDTRTPPRPALLTVPEVAEQLGRSVDAVRRLCRSGRLDARKVGKGYLIRPGALHDLMGGEF